MKIISTVNLKTLLDDLKSEFSDHDWIERSSLDDLTEDDLKTVEVLIAYDSELDVTQMPKLKWLVWYAAGVNRLQLQYMKEHGIILTNAKGIHKIQIAEFIFAYIMADYKHLDEFHELQQTRGYKTNIRTTELFESVICFLGTGEIAVRAARLAQAFGMKTIGINTDGRSIEHFDETVQLADRETAFREADIIVNVLPETEQTTELLTMDDFKAMGDSALFINVGRGTVVNESVLIAALTNRVIRKAALDVYYDEPLDSSHPLYELDNVIMTPHITGLSRRYNERATEILKQNMRMGIDNSDKFVNLVDYDKGY